MIIHSVLGDNTFIKVIIHSVLYSLLHTLYCCILLVASDTTLSKSTNKKFALPFIYIANGTVVSKIIIGCPPNNEKKIPPIA